MPPFSIRISRTLRMSRIDTDHYSWEEVYAMLGCKYFDKQIDDDLIE